MSFEREYYREVGRKIRAARSRAELTQQELADDVDLSRTSITNIESGNQPVSLWLLHQIAEALEVSTVDLVPAAGAARDSLPNDVPAKAAALIRNLAKSSSR